MLHAFTGAPPEDDDLLVPEEGEDVEEVPPLFHQARTLFTAPDVTPASEVQVRIELQMRVCNFLVPAASLLTNFVIVRCSWFGLSQMKKA